MGTSGALGRLTTLFMSYRANSIRGCSFLSPLLERPDSLAGRGQSSLAPVSDSALGQDTKVSERGLLQHGLALPTPHTHTLYIYTLCSPAAHSPFIHSTSIC